LKRYIRYLYEYENGRRIRNVGFVKVEESDESCVIHIHGKGLRLKSQTDMDVYAFYKDGNTCMGVWQGEIKNVNPTINYRLEFKPEDVGGTRRYNAIEGIILTNFSRPRYASVWNDIPADIENMMIAGKEENFSQSSAWAEPVVEDMDSAVSDITTREEERIEQPEAVMEEEMPVPESMVSEMNEHSGTQNRPSTPMEPEQPEMNQRPVMPEQPEMNQRPVMPEQPEMNQRPVMPEQPEMNQRPVMPEQPEMNQRPVMPEQPEMNQRPVMPEQPEMNQRPVMPEQPGMNQRPVMPEQPGMNQRPVMPEQPEMNQRPVMPRQPGMGQRPGMNQRPGYPGMQMRPGMGQSPPMMVQPEEPKLPIMPQPWQEPGGPGMGSPEPSECPPTMEQQEQLERPTMPQQPEQPVMPGQREMGEQPETQQRWQMMPTGQNEPTPMPVMPEEERMEPEMTPVTAEEPEINEDTAEVGAEEAPAEMDRDAELSQGRLSERDRWNDQQQVRYRKITREEMAELPRREWRLANNSFLLHGYYNYHHLVLINEDGNTYLGVPGIYHEREKTAAEAFGFGNFVKYPKDQFELSEEERDSNDFGYWYRRISRN